MKDDHFNLYCIVRVSRNTDKVDVVVIIEVEIDGKNVISHKIDLIFVFVTTLSMILREIRAKVYKTSAESFHSPNGHIVNEGNDVSLSPAIETLGFFTYSYNDLRSVSFSWLFPGVL